MEFTEAILKYECQVRIQIKNKNQVQNVLQSTDIEANINTNQPSMKSKFEFKFDIEKLNIGQRVDLATYSTSIELNLTILE